MAKSMKDRVASLLRKASDPAASEAEVNKCTEMAMDLMTKYGLSMADIDGENAEQIGESKTAFTQGRTGDAMIYVQNGIAAFTSTRVAFAGNASMGSRMTYYGYGPERELAIWLHEHIRNAIAVASRLYNPPSSFAAARSKDRRAFAIAMAARIAERLFELSETLDDSGRGGSADVLVVKNAKLDEHFAELGLRVRRARRRAFPADSMQDGRTAGDNVSLHRPVSARSEHPKPLALEGE